MSPTTTSLPHSRMLAAKQAREALRLIASLNDLPSTEDSVEAQRTLATELLRGLRHWCDYANIAYHEVDRDAHLAYIKDRA